MYPTWINFLPALGAVLALFAVIAVVKITQVVSEHLHRPMHYPAKRAHAHAH